MKLLITKKCLKCHQDKPLSAFGSNRNAPDGFNVYCKKCAAQISRENRVLTGLKRWLDTHSDGCCRCGSKERVSILWLQVFMLPVSICMACNVEYLSYKDITINEFYQWLRQKKCLKCGHEWLAQSPDPLRCPNCKSPRWQEEEEITNE